MMKGSMSATREVLPSCEACKAAIITALTMYAYCCNGDMKDLEQPSGF